jgi:hypothetical protein
MARGEGPEDVRACTSILWCAKRARPLAMLGGRAPECLLGNVEVEVF